MVTEVGHRVSKAERMIINYVLDIGVFRQTPSIGIFQQEDNKHLFWSLALHASGTVLGDLSFKKRVHIPFPISLPLHEHSSPSPSPQTTMSSSAREEVGEEPKVDELEEQAETEPGLSRRSLLPPRARTSCPRRAHLSTC